MYRRLHLLFLVLCLAVPVSAFINNCANGVYSCSRTDNDFTVTASSLMVQNCVYISCPAVVIQSSNSTVTFNGVFFYYSRNPNGAIIVNNTNIALNINNGGFFHGMHSGVGTVNVASTGAVVSIQSTQFINNTGAQSGGISMLIGGSLTVRNGTFLRNPGLGGIGIRMSNGGSASILNSEFGWQVYAIKANALCSVYVKTCSFHDLAVTGDSGTVVSIYDRCSAVFEDSIVFNVSALDDKGGAIKIQDRSVMYIQRSIFTNCRGDSGGAVAIQQPGALGYIYNCSFINNYGVSEGGALSILFGGAMNLYNNIFLGCSCTLGGTISANFNTQYYAQNNTIVGSTGVKNGIIDIRMNSYFYSRDLTILNCIGSSGLQVESTLSLAVLSGTTTIANIYNVMGEAGALTSIGNSLIVLNDRVRILNNTGTLAGAIYTGEQGKIQLNSTDIVLQNNTATNDARGNGLYGQSKAFPDGLLVTTGSPLFSVLDNFLIVTKECATGIMTQQVASMLPSILISGNPSALQLAPGTRIASTMNLLLSQPIPNLKIQVVDYFGNLVPANPYQPIVIAMTETSQGAQLSGESIQALVDGSTNYVEFKGVTLKRIAPGFYSFLVSPVGNLVDPLPNPIPLPAFNVTYLDCDPVKERLILTENKCYPAVTYNSGVRLFLGILNLLVAVLGVGGVIGIQAYRDYHLVKANSSFFLSIIGGGCVLSTLSFGIRVSSFEGSCMLSLWLSNLGMAFIFTSLMLKTSRIQEVFLKGLGKATVLKDEQLLKIFGIVILVISAFMITWNMVAPSTFTEIYFYRQYVLVGSCSKSSFSDVAIIIRLFIQLINAYLAYCIRNVPSDFNESQQIGFATYNWIIFGAVFKVIQDYAVSDPNVSFAIEGASVFLTNILTLVILIYSKVYNCLFFPERSVKRAHKEAKITTN